MYFRVAYKSVKRGEYNIYFLLVSHLSCDFRVHFLTIWRTFRKPYGVAFYSRPEWKGGLLWIGSVCGMKSHICILLQLRIHPEKLAKGHHGGFAMIQEGDGPL